MLMTVVNWAPIFSSTDELLCKHKLFSSLLASGKSNLVLKYLAVKKITKNITNAKAVSGFLENLKQETMLPAQGR
jgi:hypothetical protein